MTALTMAATSAPRGMAPQLEPALWKPGDRAAPVSISCAILPLRRRSSAFVVSFPRGLATWRMDRRASPVVASVATEEATGVLEPKPTVLIDQDSDADATIVEISFGDRLGALLDTIKALKDLGLNVIKGVVTSEGGNLRRKKFLVTRADNNKKVENPELLEAIRLTIINNLLKYHPESGEQLALGVAFGGHPPEQELDVDVATHISVTRDGGRSLLSVETADRPGLLLEILNVICDISIYVESAEIDTMGLVAKDKFYVTYHGEQLSPSMEEVLTNSLVYYLRRPDTEEDSY